MSLAVVACLLPFVGKAFHIDDPMYLWAAQRIQTAPLDFYGLHVNWNGVIEPMAVANKNPPGVSFYLAFVGSVLGWGERGLHLGMMAPAVALLLAVYALAARLCASPRTAALATLTMPGVLVSATTLMSDVLMLALWCWSLWLWLTGLERRSLPLLLLGGLAAGLCIWTKYIGISLIPLMAVTAVLRWRRPGAWLLALLVPVGMLLALDAYMNARYGVSPLAHLVPFAQAARGDEDALLGRGVIALSFLGGCLLTTLFLSPLVWSGRALLAWGVLPILLAALLPGLAAVARLSPGGAGGMDWLGVLHLAVFVSVGAQCAALALDDVRRHRDPDALLLALWVVGVLAFVGFVNWTANARAVLPAAPAVAILLMRRLEHRRGPGAGDASLGPQLALVPALVLALAVTWADARLAESARQAAGQLSERYRSAGSTLWFQGAWGFQLYMERAGAKKLDVRRSHMAPGDIVVEPRNNTLPSFVVGGRLYTSTAPLEGTLPQERASFPVSAWLATMALPRGAGFYTSGWGPLPFALGPVPDEHYDVLLVTRRLRPSRAGIPGWEVY